MKKKIHFFLFRLSLSFLLDLCFFSFFLSQRSTDEGSEGWMEKNEGEGGVELEGKERKRR
jgi:hypothetical protein